MFISPAYKQQTDVLQRHPIDLPQWSHVWHPEQMIHALVEWQETRVCQGRHPKKRNAMVSNIATRSATSAILGNFRKMFGNACTAFG